MKTLHRWGIYFCIVWMLFLYSCANPAGALSGGVKDVIPPQLDSLKSTPTPSVNFSDKEIYLAFNEWVKLDNPYSQVVISPPLEYRPKIERKGKGVVVTLDGREQLKENTTYIFQFGTAIKDLTEGNAAQNLKLVLSTGNEVDSLTLKGQVFDQISGQGERDVLVMLYENTADSVVRTEKPYYFTKTDASGNFTLDYLKKGRYKIFALKDVNSNYLFDQPQEKIGFQDSLIVLPDTSRARVELKVFQEEPPLIITGRELRRYGVMKFIFNQPPTGVKTNVKDVFKNPVSQAISKDTILIWYSDTSKIQRDIIFSSSSSFQDTIRFKMPKLGKTPYPEYARSNPTTIDVSPIDTLRLAFETPLAMIDTSKIIIEQDSVPYNGKREIRLSAKDTRSLEIDLDRKENAKLTLTFLPNAVQNIWNKGNRDTITQQVHLAPISEFGDLDITLLLPDSTRQYLIRLLNPQQEVIGYFMANNVSSFNIQQKTLPAGAYQVRIVEDLNKNGKQDSGNYEEKRQPERIFEKTLEQLRKNWVLETEVPVEF